MFNLFRKLFGGDNAAADAAKKVTHPMPSGASALKEPAASAACAPELPVAHSFVCREAALGRDERISGYEFLLPDRVQTRLQGSVDADSLHKAYDDALLHNLCSLGSSTLLGSRFAFVRLSLASLDNPLIARLPASNTVLLFSPSRKAPDPAVVRPRFDELGQQGFACGWLLRREQLDEHAELAGLAASADFAQLETGSFDGVQIKALLKSLHAARPAERPAMRFMASGIATVDEYNLCFHGGFDFFLGKFVNSRENWIPPKSNTNPLHIIELLNMLRSGAEFDAIAHKLKLDPVLTFKLLRYLNSPVMGLLSPVTTMDKALIVLGRERFFRWLSLFLFDIKAPGYRDRALTEQALARAHFLESLAGQGAIPASKDQLFMLGLFSLIDLLMGQSMSEMLQQAKLPEPVHQALLGQPGAYGDALALAIAAEGLSQEDIEAKAGSCRLAALQVSRSAIEALEWAHEVSSLGEG
jgi:EAL and modified HD-GYP domain-containing signal transduction protein